MKPTLTFTAADIRAALFKVLDDKYSSLYNNKLEAPMIELVGTGNDIQAILTFRAKSTGSDWD